MYILLFGLSHKQYDGDFRKLIRF